MIYPSRSVPTRRAAVGAALSSLLLLAAACSSEAPPTEPRLILVYAPCSVSAKHLAPYDDRVPYTPSLAAFAADAVTFDHHYTESPSSGIAYASLFTGTQADRHGVYRHPLQLPEDLTLMTEVFAEAGYETYFWGAHPMATAELGYAQGVPPSNRFGRRLNAGDRRFVALLAKLAADPSAKALVVTHFSVTHGPYVSGPGGAAFLRRYPDLVKPLKPREALAYQARYRRRHWELAWDRPKAFREMKLAPRQIEGLVHAIELVYASTVTELDRLFGTVVDKVDQAGLRDDSLIVFTADHGEMLYREDEPFSWSHSMQVAPDVVRVPFLIRWPAAGLTMTRYEQPTRSIDVLPTLLGLTGIEVPAGAEFEGVDLSAALRGETPPPELEAYSHSTVLAQGVVDQMADPRHAGRWELVKR
jgi:arylsulfatase A-like enzyme